MIQAPPGAAIGGEGEAVESGPGPATTGRRLHGLVLCARPGQWIKNLACFAGLIFSGRLLFADSIAWACLAFAGFCLAASGLYLINDVCDRDLDRRNPKKRDRPIASGLLPIPWALAASVALLAAAMGSALVLPGLCRGVLAAYILLNLAYSVRLKHTVLLDVMTIAFGFVLRVLYGVYAVRVAPSPWIVLCMFFLALFLGFAKRRSELQAGGGEGPQRRPVLSKYDLPFLDMLLAMTATMSVLAYALYTVTGRPNASMVVTVPLVVYGVFRYLLLVLVHGVGDMPEKQLVDDPVSIAIVALWAALCAVCIYFPVAQIFLGK